MLALQLYQVLYLLTYPIGALLNQDFVVWKAQLLTTIWDVDNTVTGLHFANGKRSLVIDSANKKWFAIL